MRGRAGNRTRRRPRPPAPFGRLESVDCREFARLRRVRKTLAALAVVLCAAPTATASPLITLTGRGWGHGIGMAQDGAEGMAQKGATSRQILSHFYPHTALDTRRGQRIRVLLREARAVTIRTGAGARVRADGGAAIAVVGPVTAQQLAGGRVRLLAGAKEVARGAILRVSGGSPIRVSSHGTGARSSCAGSAAASARSTTWHSRTTSAA